MERQGQRLLLALTSQTDVADDSSGVYTFVGTVFAFGGLMCVIFVIFMCTCKDGERKHEHEGQELQQSSKKGDKKSMAQLHQDGADIKSKADLETVTVNGSMPQASSTLPGHSRQASSGSAHMRPTSLRELPAPPVSTTNKALCGVESPNTSTKAGGASATAGAGSGDYPYHQHAHHSRNSKTAAPGSVPSGKEKVKLQSDGYDHLGPKRTSKPTDYDSLDDEEPESTDGETPVSETGGGLDGHYSLLRERTYAVVVDVKAKAKELFDPYSKVKDKDDAGSDYYSQVKEEDTYNHIGDSGGNVSLSFIHQLRQSRDLRDTYAAAQNDSGSDMKSIMESRETARGTLPHTTSTTSNRMLSSPTTPQDDADVEEEYAVVQKAKGVEQAAENHGQTYTEGDISPYGVGPPEPPRLYSDYDNTEGAFTSATPTSYKREHKYSKVTARESLASMSARNALNPYEVVVDLPENTYATVEGGSGDGVVLRGGVTNSTVEKRLSQASDTYAEIGISGGGLSSSIISSNSSTGGNNNNSGSSSIAPIPPSLDSLHLMTKSQTSSEGDRLSDRHLASPEDSGMSLNLWGEDQDDDDSEDGYSTLKKLEYSPEHSSLQNIPNSTLITDEDSGEVTLVPNYQKVKDCISDNEITEETENDPNYESVDEARAKVALLKARTASSLDSRTFQLTSLASTSSHINSLKVDTVNNSMTPSSTDSIGNKDELLTGGQRRRRLDHDYEEVDLSPPSSPVSPPSSRNHANSSLFHNTLNHSSITVETGTVLNVNDERERAVQSHMYEELTEVRAKTSEMNRVKKASSQSKNNSEDKKKTSSNDKKKLEDKVKSSNDDKRKNTLEDKRRNASEDKRKSGSEDKHKFMGEDKKKNTGNDKRKSGSDDKKKGGMFVVNGTRL